MYMKKLLFRVGLCFALCIVSIHFSVAKKSFAMEPEMAAAKEAARQLHQPLEIKLRTEKEREQTVTELRRRARLNRDSIQELARKKGLKIRGQKADGGVFELIGIREDGRLMYIETQNEHAAISTAVDQIRETAPFNLTGSGVNVGVWDGGAVMPDHVEFEQRVTVSDALALSDHATHVGGTIGAAGIDPLAMGMAPDCTILSFSWGSDLTEMTELAATSPDQDDKVYISNHSYAASAGWGWWGADSAFPGFHWYGPLGEGIVEDDIFGTYGGKDSLVDALVYSSGYYLPVWAASNNRNNSAPTAGDVFYYLDDGDWLEKEYDPVTDPLGDGALTGGYNTIPSWSVAKNTLTVGAVTDAVAGGIRSSGHAAMSSFSSWGPTNDGRIKPDVVGNGVGLWSASFDEDTPDAINGYGWKDGTSMASPNVTGTAALLLEYYDTLFPAQAMRAATLKGLLIHTADDLEQAGPDYQTGWGLVDGRAAVEVIRLQHLESERSRIIEAVKGAINQEFTFTYVGDSSIRVTLSWSDPAGPTLINDLDLRLIAPDGTTHYPYVNDPQSPANPAAQGDNFRDPVEQIYIPVQYPPIGGEWTIQISHKGNLQNGSQPFSLLVNAWIPPTENDNLDQAIELTGNIGQIISYTNGATLEVDEPNHAGVSIGKSVWYKLTASFDGPVTINTYGSHFNTTLGVYRNPPTFLELASNDDFAYDQQHSEVVFTAETGVEYYIAVDGTGPVNHGRVLLNYHAVPSPDNDTFAERKTIEASDVSTNIGAGVDNGEPDHAGAGSTQSVWWTFSLSHSGQITVDTQGSDFDTALAVYTGNTITGLIEVASNDNALLNWASEVSFYAQAGVDYHVAVCGGQLGGNYHNVFSGNVQLNVRPANDDLEDRLVISGLQGQHTGVQNGATVEEDLFFAFSGYRPRRTIWWSWTAPATGDILFSIEAAMANRYRLGVFRNNGTFSEPELVVKEQIIGDFADKIDVSLRVSEGSEYIILLGTKTDHFRSPDQITISWQPLAGTNDHISYSRVIDNDSHLHIFSNNTEATASYGEPAHAGMTANKSLWYRWVKKEGELEVNLDTFGSESDTVLAVYMGSLYYSGLTPVTANDNYGNPQSKVQFCTNEPKDYFVAVDSHDQGGIILLNATPGTTQSQLTLYRTGNGSVLVNGVERDPIWSHWFDTCSEITLEPLPDFHYHFVEWQEDISSTDPILNLVLSGSVGIRAVFAEDPQYTLSLSGTGSGQVMVDGQTQDLPWSGSFYVGETVVLRAVPAATYGFDNWTGAISTESGVITVTVENNLNIAANFSLRSSDKKVITREGRDTTLYEDANGQFGNGHGQFFFTGSHGGVVRRGLLAFDLQGIVPSGATITSAVLHLHHSAQDSTGENDILFVRAAKAWGEGESDASGDETAGTQAQEGDATWLNNNYSAGLWDNPGGDFDQAAGARGWARIDGPGDYQIAINSSSNPGLLEDLRYWSNNPEVNQGWLTVAENEQSIPAKRFHSRENVDVNSKPHLAITYYTGSAVPPLITVDSLKSGNPKPQLTGTINDVDAAITIGYQRGILWETVPATNNGDGTWTLPEGNLLYLQPGIYSFRATAIDSNNNTGIDPTDNEVEIVPSDYVQETCVSNEGEFQTALTIAQENELIDHIKLEQGVYSVLENQGQNGVLPFTYYSEKEYSLHVTGGYSLNCSRQEKNALLTRLDGEQRNKTLEITSRGTGAQIEVEWITIENGDANTGGGATILTTGGSNILSHCIVRRNVSSNNGGGVRLDSVNSNINLSNCLLAENQSAGDGGGAVLQAGDSVTCTGNTIVYNSLNGTSRDKGGGLFITLTGTTGGLNIFNSIFWNNSTVDGTEAIGASIAVENINNLPIEFMYNGLLLNTIEGFTDSTGTNLEVEPIFVDESAGDYHLAQNSLLINSGNNQALGLAAYDLDGLARIARDCSGSLQVDVGAYESAQGIVGDIDCSGQVDLADVIILLQTVTGGNTSSMSMVLDIANDERLGLAEAISVLQNIAEM